MKPIEVVTGNCHFHIKRVISSTDVIQLTLTLNMTSAQVVKKSVTVIKSPNFRTTFTRTIILDLLMKLMTPGLRPFTVLRSLGRRSERLANDYVSYSNTRTTTLVQLPLQRSRLCSERTLNLSPRWTHKRPVKSPRPPVDDRSEHGWTTVTEDSTTTTTKYSYDLTNLNNFYRLPYLALYRLLLTNALTRELSSTARKRNKLTNNAKRRKPDANWVRNISSGPLDEIETQVLSYGLKHSVTPKQIPTEANVSSVEAVLSGQHEPIRINQG